MPLSDTDIARRFRQIADILEIQGENPFKVRAYRTAAETIDGLEDSLADLAARDALPELPGFGPAIVAKTRDFLDSGTTALWERVKDAVPEGVVVLAGVPGVGPKTAKALWEGLGVEDVDAAEAAARAERVRTLPGFAAAKESALLEKIAAWRRLSARTPRWRALPLAEKIAAELRRLPEVRAATLAGELRAGCDTVAEAVLEVDGTLPWETRSVDGLTVRLLPALPDPDPRVPWEVRHDPDLADAARGGTLRLVAEADFQGQLHEHTTWSDGRASVREMAEAALARGYRYLAVTDHSRVLTVANGLSRERLLAQIDEIDALNAHFVPRGLTLLSGLEADILADGSLDMDDDVLARLDIVVGSVHLRFKEDADQMTRRMVAAIENPRLDIVGHPTGRLLGRREAYPVDVDAVIAAAARCGKALEINAAPERMDLCDAYVRRAKAAGVVLSVNADAHSVAGLGGLSWGLCMARRAGLEPDDVINTWSLERLRAWKAGR